MFVPIFLFSFVKLTVPDGNEALENLNVKVTPEVHDYLEAAKREGHSKKSVLTWFVSLAECFGNYAELGVTESTILQKKYLEGLWDEAKRNGASLAELEALEKAIKVLKDTLEKFKKEGAAKI